MQIEDVEWRVRQVGDLVQWDVENRAVGIEVRVPRNYNAQEQVLSDIGAAVAARVAAVAPPSDGEPTHDETPH
jgi:hypothetical protein